MRERKREHKRWYDLAWWSMFMGKALDNYIFDISTLCCTMNSSRVYIQTIITRVSACELIS